MRILFVGDIVGKGGRKAVTAWVPQLRTEFGCDFCIANGENMAGGGGLSKRCLEELSHAEVDVFTSGDHVWDQRDFVTEIQHQPAVLRPANVHPDQPGRGHGVFMGTNGIPVAVINLLGRTFMNSLADCPFQAVDRILPQLQHKARIVVVDFHAEATSEKIAMGRYLDGRVTAVLGTHTHVATADEDVFPGGTAFQCDVGMVGGRDSVLGRDLRPVLQRFSTGMPARFTVTTSGIRLNATVVDVGNNGRAVRIERVVRDMP